MKAAFTQNIGQQYARFLISSTATTLPGMTLDILYMIFDNLGVILIFWA